MPAQPLPPPVPPVAAPPPGDVVVASGSISSRRRHPLRPSGTRPGLALRGLQRELLAGLVGAFALMPESISFAVVAGLNPLVGIMTAATMAIATSLFGGRPAMVSGAAGSVALVVSPMVHHHGLPWLSATLLLAGALQIVAGLCGVARLIRRLPRSVVTGFVNGLAGLILLAQVPNFEHVPWAVYPLSLAGLALVVALPRWVRAIPAPLIAIVVLTAATALLHLHVPTLGQKAGLAHWSVPHPALPHLGLSLGGAATIAAYAVAVAGVGLLESLMTAQLVDEWTETTSSKRREACGQGAANIVSAVLGGMGGCAMIGQTVINLRSGGRTRLSCFGAGLAIVVLTVLVRGQLSRVPMAALAAVMVVVAATTFDRRSVTRRSLRQASWADRGGMVVTAGVTVATSDLAIGVVAGVAAYAVLSRTTRRAPVRP
jgi:SulP family sulfate permease